VLTFAAGRRVRGLAETKVTCRPASLVLNGIYGGRVVRRGRLVVGAEGIIRPRKAQNTLSQTGE
jgi:hypothetical protein